MSVTISHAELIARDTFGVRILDVLLDQTKGMFTRHKLLLPSLDFFSLRESHRVHDTLNHGGELPARLIDISLGTRVAHYRSSDVISIVLRFRGDRKLRDFWGWLVPLGK